MIAASLQDLQKVVQLLQDQRVFSTIAGRRLDHFDEPDVSLSSESADAQEIGDLDGLVGSCLRTGPLLDPLSPVDVDILEQKLASCHDRAKVGR